MAETYAERILKAMLKHGGNPDDTWALAPYGDGFVRFDGSFVHIQRAGVFGRLAVGKGAKRIPVHQITSIQLKPAGPVVEGFIQFTVGGSVERRSAFGRQSYDAFFDENSMTFTKHEEPHFERLRDVVEAAIAARFAPPAQPAPQYAAFDMADQLGRLAALRDSGVLTDEEFAVQKARLLA